MDKKDRPMLVAYVAGPYRASTTWKINQNIERAKKVALEVWKMGYVAICPHANTGLFDGEMPDKTWLDGDLELLRRSDFVVLVPGWETSEGTKIEADLSSRLGKPVYTIHALREKAKGEST